MALVALVLRLAVGYELAAKYPPVSHPASATDMATYLDLGQAVFRGSYDYHQGFYYQPFYYTAFLPALFATGLPPATAIYAGQALVAALAVWLLGLSVARLYGRFAGLAAAALLALARMHIFKGSVALLEVLQSFWVVAFCYLGLWAARGTARQPWRWALCGLVGGLGVVTRGNFLLLWPVALAYLAWQYRRQPRRLVLAALLFLAGGYLPQLPYAVTNYRVMGEWVGPSTAGPAVLALGNTPESPPGGRDPGTGAGPMEYPESYGRWRQLATDPGPERRGIAAQVADWLRQQPLAWPELKWRMLLLFWNQDEIPNNVALQDAMGHWVPSKVLQLPLLVDFLALGALALTGSLLLWQRRRGHPSRLWLLGLLWAYCASVVVFYMLARFRVPGLPLLCGVGGVAVAELATGLGRWYRRGWLAARSSLRLGLPSFLLAALVVGWGYDLYRYGWEARVLRWVRPTGSQLVEAERRQAWWYGPMSFGGWQPVALPSGMPVTLTWQPPPLAANEPVILRFPVLSDGAGSLAIQAGSAAPEVLTLARLTNLLEPAQWTTITLPPPTPGQPYSLTFTARPNSGNLQLVLDTQRDYGATQWAALPTAPPPGEWVARAAQSRLQISTNPAPPAPVAP